MGRSKGREFKMNEQKVYSKKCEKCGKEIVSLNERQLKFNMEAHERSCKERK